MTECVRVRLSILLPFLVVAMLISSVAMAAFPSVAFADGEEGSANSSPDYTSQLQEISGKLDSLNETVAGFQAEDDEESGSASYVTDFFFVQCSVCVLLSLVVGLLCWLCFRIR